MTQEQVAKAKELSEKIGYIAEVIEYITMEHTPPYILKSYLCERVCRIAKDDILPIFEKKLQELKNELAAL